MSEYHTIVADPPWEIAKGMGPGGRRSNKTVVPYEFMTLDAIGALEVSQYSMPDAVLFLWCTRKVFREGWGCRVARAWGFEPCGEMVWGLRNPGAGSRTIANDHEPVLIARKGQTLLKSESPLGVFFWKQVYEIGAAGVPQKKHSAKPPAFLDLVEQISPGPYLELFARERRLGWDAWGNEVDSDIAMAS